ncbi:MAG: hypothetical protein ACR2QM_13535 [Longimicrobiales bacterium]
MSPLSRAIAGEHLAFTLSEQISELRQDESYLRSGRTGRTLVKSGHLRITLTLISDGVEVGTHQAETPMTLQVLEGGLAYSVEGQELELAQGQLLFFGEGHAKDIRALGDTALLLTITGGDEG